jgi:hypothetical protein
MADSQRPAIIYQQDAPEAGLAITSATGACIATAKAGQGRDSGDRSAEQLKLSNPGYSWAERLIAAPTLESAPDLGR